MEKNQSPVPPQPLATRKSKLSVWIGLGILALFVLGLIGFASTNGGQQQVVETTDIEFTADTE